LHKRRSAVTPPPPPSGFRSKLVRQGPGSHRLQRALTEAEEACRAAASACMSHLQASGAKQASDVDACAHLIMDCSYIAAATGRLLGRFDRQDPEVVMFQLEVCRRAAAACADACGHRVSTPILEVCSRLTRQCARACAALLALFRAQPAVLLSEDGADEQGGAASMSETG
jgi:hypothetical protein